MIYFDNASTSFPKADGVSLAVKEFIDKSCFNINRGEYTGARDISESVFETRELLCEFFGGNSGKNVVFTGGLTLAINIVLKGMLASGDRVLTSMIEHNAVMRPLKQLEKTGIEIEYFKCNNQGEIDLIDFENKLKNKPKLVMANHASNVCGTMLPIDKMGQLCKKYDVFFAVDTAQTAGVIKINAVKDNIDFLCFTAHKGLLALGGLGGIVLSDKAAKQITPIISGGTGSFSSSVEIPSLLPDKLEAGTMNLAGILALNRSIKFLNKTGIESIYQKEKALQNYFEAQIKDLAWIKLIAARAQNKCAVTSIDFVDKDCGEIAYILDEEYKIMARSGIHCAPCAHKTINTLPKGTLRFSFGHTNTFKEIDVLIDALKKIY